MFGCHNRKIKTYSEIIENKNTTYQNCKMNQNSTQKKSHSFKSTHEEKERLRNMSQVSNSKLKNEEQNRLKQIEKRKKRVKIIKKIIIGSTKPKQLI